MTRIDIRLEVTAAAVSMILASGQPFASSHTDAPFITLDPAANTTDVYALRSERGGQAYLTTAAAVYPFEEQNLDHQAQLNQLAPQEAAPPSLHRAQEPGADSHRALGDEAVVYHWRKTVSPDGRAVERTPVSELVDWLDAGGEIDLEHLVDSRGRHYRLVADAWQEAEEEDVHYEVKLVRYAKQYQSAEEIEKSWRQTYPFATRAEFDAFQAERRSRPALPDTNNLDDMREAAQVTELHDDGHDGETASGRSSVNDIYLAILDTDIDADHPAWDDWSGGPSRLVDVWRKTGGVWGTVTTSATATYIQMSDRRAAQAPTTA